MLKASLESQPCVNAGWEDHLTAEVVAASIAYGHGLDDLAPDLVSVLTDSARECLTDRQWWIDDVALNLKGVNDMTADQADCVAEAYIGTLGIGEVIRRRILTLPLLAVSPSEQVEHALPRRCGIEPIEPLVQLSAPVGACLTGFGSGTAATTVIDCIGEHNGEVIGVHDLSTEFPVWPGAQVVRAAAQRHCVEDFQAATDIASYRAAGWDIPSRTRPGSNQYVP